MKTYNIKPICAGPCKGTSLVYILHDGKYYCCSCYLKEFVENESDLACQSTLKMKEQEAHCS